MHRYALITLLVLAGALVACQSGGDNLPTPERDATVATPAQRYVVGFALGTAAQEMTALTDGLANRPSHSYRTAFNGFAAVLTGAERAALATDARVAFIEPDLAFSITKGKPPGVGGGGGGDESQPEVLPWGADRIGSELNGGTGGNGVAVAVLDTGIDLDHPDLVGNVIDGYNFVKPGEPADDDNGHGSHVAGTIAAVDNDIGYIGVAPQAKVVAVKVLDRRGRGWMSDIIAGIDWVAQNASSYGIKVANMSLGARGTSSALAAAISGATAAGVTFVVSAGNSDADAAAYIPASYSSVICVSAIDSADNFAYFSNYGAVVDITAPGVSVPSLYKNGGYKTLSGTSMSAPHVAGAAALWLDNHAGTFTDVYDALTAVPPAGTAEPGPWSGDPDSYPEPLVNAGLL